MNLVSSDDLERLESRHLLDSLAFALHLRGARIADLGTGAGLPGVPLAIACPNVCLTLIDRSEKRFPFVRQALADLELRNVELLVTDIARFRPATGFDTVVARALALPDATWRLARPLLAPHGRAIWATAEHAPLPDVGEGTVTTHPVVLPGIERRHQLIVVDLVGVDTRGPPDT
jgi:16S rRNA (guanine527-N7)-methyltransferase